GALRRRRRLRRKCRREARQPHPDLLAAVRHHVPHRRHQRALPSGRRVRYEGTRALPRQGRRQGRAPMIWGVPTDVVVWGAESEQRTICALPTTRERGRRHRSRRLSPALRKTLPAGTTTVERRARDDAYYTAAATFDIAVRVVSKP